eukprot:4666134-Karenia_brevis.AAC.1
MARGLPITYATMPRTFVDDIRSIGKGFEAWVLQAQWSTSQILVSGLRGAKCRISKKPSVIGSKKNLVTIHHRRL